MATVRSGNKGALVVVDVQVGVMRGAWEAARIVGNVVRAVERARSANVPVIWVQHADEELPKDSPQWQWVPELVPAPGETCVHKQFNSSFEQTSLDSALAALGAIAAQSIVQELNVAMQWLAYPGRKNGTASAEQVSFTR